MIRVLGSFIALFLSAVAHGELAGEACDPPAGSVTGEARWRCHIFTTPVIDHTAFQIRLRWNRPDQPSAATAVWLAGGDGRTAHDEFEQGLHDADASAADQRSIRQRLSDEFAVRSIELQFLNSPDTATALGGYWAAPRRGFIKPAKAFMAALEYLGQPAVSLLRGDWLTVVGSSNGSTVMAFALAYLDAEQFFDRAVLISGPFWGDTLRECRDPSFVAYVGQNDASPLNRVPSAQIYADVSVQNGWPDCRAGGLDDFQRSALGDGSARRFPSIEIDVIVGEDDEFGPWLINSNRYWYESIDAFNASYTALAGVDHSPWGIDRATQALLTQTIAKPPRLAAEGLFTVAGRAIFYSNGSHHCYFPTVATYQRLTGRRDSASLPDYRRLPMGSGDDGVCGDQTPTGLFTVGAKDIYYSNGTRYCYFPTVATYQRLTGRDTSAGVTNYDALPAALEYDGPCRG